MEKTIDTTIKAILLVTTLAMCARMPRLFPLSHLVIPAGIYLSAHPLLRFLWRRWSRTRKSIGNVEGTWIYVLPGRCPARNTYGMFRIETPLSGLKVAGGEAWYFGSPPKPACRQAVWSSRAAIADAHRLWFIFRMTLLRPPEGQRARRCSGAMEIRLDEEGIIENRPVISGTGKIFPDRGAAAVLRVHKASGSISAHQLPDLILEAFGEDVLKRSASPKKSRGKVIYMADLRPEGVQN